MVLTEGRKRQLRRMLAALGLGVRRLKRTRAGNLELGRLRSGQWRRLEEDEVRRLAGHPKTDAGLATKARNHEKKAIPDAEGTSPFR